MVLIVVYVSILMCVFALASWRLNLTREAVWLSGFGFDVEFYSLVRAWTGLR